MDIDMKTFLHVTFLTFLLIASSAFSASSTAKDKAYSSAVALDLLIGSDDITGVRLAYRPYVYRLTDVPFFDELDIYWEASVNFWEFGENNQHETNFVLALSPVVSKTFYHVNNRNPLKWEFGIGVSLVNDTQFAGKDIGSHYQFEDRLGLTLDFGKRLNQSVSLRYMHYSNGGLNSKNPGVDFLNLSYAYKI
jgi:hypothetical protein